MATHLRNSITLIASLSSVLVLTGFSSHALAMSPFQANYQFSYNGRNMGSGTRTLTQQNANNWTYNFSARAGVIASASEVSKFSFNGGQITSQQFDRNSKILVHNNSMSVQFNPSAKVINTERDGKKRSFPWREGVLDELNAELQIREDLKKNQNLKTSYFIADAKGIDARRFVRQGNESVKTPYGTFQTVKVVIQYNNRPERNTTFWLAPQLDYLPVKVSHADGNASYGLLLTDYKGKTN